jgi:putative transposase
MTLSDRDAEELLCKRGIMVSCEAIRQSWCTFGQSYANQLRRRRPRPGDNWHLDEVVLTLHGRRHDLWRAVDQDENVLDILVPSRRNKRAAKTFVKNLLKGLPYVPRVISTDLLKRDAAATGEVMPGVEHRQHRSLKNRCEHSHRPTRARARRTQRSKSPGQARRLLFAYGPIGQHFRPRRHLLSASAYRQAMSRRFESWAEITGTERAA